MDSDDNNLGRKMRDLETRIYSLEKTLYDVTVYLQHQAKQSDTSPSLMTESIEKSVEPPPQSIPVLPSTKDAAEPKPPSTKSNSLIPEDKSSSTESNRISYRQPERKPFTIPDYMKKSEFWLNKAGIALILFSVVFAFKYSIDKGWLIPAVRIGFGFAVGLILNGFGVNLYNRSRHFALVLLGGGIATFYITGFAAFQVFAIVSHSATFGFMIAVTILAYVLALRQNEPILSLIGVLGGLGTPFMLYTGQGNIPGLILYTSLIIAGSCAVYFFKGWRSLLMLTVFGGWIVYVVAQVNGLPVSKTEAIPDRWAIQYGLIFCWLSFWLIPLLRESLAQRKPESWAWPPLLLGGKPIPSEMQAAVHRHVHLICISSPFIAFGLTKDLWMLPDTTWAIITLSIGVAYGLISALVNKYKIRDGLAYTNGLIGLFFFSISLSFFFSGATLSIALGAEALILFLISRRQADRIIAACAHIVFGITALMVFSDITTSAHPSHPLFNKDALANLWIVALIITVSIRSIHNLVRQLYYMVGAFLLAGILCREFTGNAHFLALTLEAAAIQLFSKKYSEKHTYIFGCLFMFGMAAWMVYRLSAHHQAGSPIVGDQSLVDLSFLAISAGAAYIIAVKERYVEKIFYALTAHIGLMLWMLREFESLPNNQGFVTVGWGVYAVVLLIIGLRRDFHKVRITALLTLLVVVGKLFLVDLSRIDAIWRVLVFLGFGGIFLLLSYYFKALWKKPVEAAPSTDVEDNTNDI